MAVYFYTKTPRKLLNVFKKAIDERRVLTWSYDEDGDLTHTAQQWKNLAWFRPKIISNKKLILNIIKPQNQNISTEIYAIYHGRLIESMLVHCDQFFTKASSTALPSINDIVN